MGKVFKLLALLVLVLSLNVSCANVSDGKDGDSIIWKGSYATAPADPEYLWAYYNTTDGCSYLWDGTKWTVLAGKSGGTYDVIVAELDFKDVDLHIYSAGEIKNVGTIPLGFMDGDTDIPYIVIDGDNLKSLLEDDFTVSDVNESTKAVTVTKNSQQMVFDLVTRTCSFTNYDEFFKNSLVYMDPAACNSVDYMKITDYANIAGQPVVLDWSTQDIKAVICKDGDEYCFAIPLQFFNDIFMAPNQTYFIYNGTYLYSSAHLSYKDLRDEYYSKAVKKSVRSQTLAEFCYNELCLNLDLNYGLKSLHGIDAYPNFDTWFACLGIKNRLMSTDPATFADALHDVCDFYFGDGHSNYMYNSYYLGGDVKISGTMTSYQSKNYDANTLLYNTARAKNYGGNVEEADIPAYEISSDGKTAIVRFDYFTLNGYKKDYIKEHKIDDGYLAEYVDDLEDLYDTIALIHTVNDKIQNDSSIENVVLDLSCNGGGANHSAAVVLAWMLGECNFYFTNPISGAKWYATYKVDVNCDGTYDASDTVKSKNLFCIISPLSFSCGNMVPAMLKASDRVTILGAASSGGTSCVQPSAAADGTVFRMSSKYVMSAEKNGSTYDLDQGVEPHYYINIPENFYKKDTIASLVTKINSGL